MGNPKEAPTRKKPKKIRLRLTAADGTDPRTNGLKEGETIYTWRRVDGNDRGLDADILRVLSPEDFGIHANLSKDERKRLCQEVYGTDDVPATAAVAPSPAPQGPNPSDLLADADEGDDLSGKPFGEQEDVEEGTDDYFPHDGYDYEKHLRPIGRGGFGSVFIPYKGKKAVNVAPAEESVDPEFYESVEGRELLKALEEEEVGVEEQLDDDFVAKAKFCKKGHERDLLWGPAKPLIGGMGAAVVDPLEAELFAKLLADYAESEEEAGDVEGLDKEGDDADGPMDHVMLKAIRREEKLKQEKESAFSKEEIKAMTRNVIGAMDESDGESTISNVSDAFEPEWDCRSVLTTRSTTSHHPSVISRPFKPRRSVPPREAAANLYQIVEESLKPAAKATDAGSDADDIGEIAELRQNVNFERKREETVEERRARKQGVKEFQRESRRLKKEKRNDEKSALGTQRKIVAAKNPFDVREGIRKVRYA